MYNKRRIFLEMLQVYKPGARPFLEFTFINPGPVPFWNLHLSEKYLLGTEKTAIAIFAYIFFYSGA